MTCSLFTEQNRQELETQGFTVVTNVLDQQECAHFVQQYKQWLASNFRDGEFPLCSHSLIQRYGIGHLEPSWHVRLKSRDVFAGLWGTERLVSSVDAVAIGECPYAWCVKGGVSISANFRSRPSVFITNTAAVLCDQLPT
jgi:hypothetical protein